MDSLALSDYCELAAATNPAMNSDNRRRDFDSTRGVPDFLYGHSCHFDVIDDRTGNGFDRNNYH